MLKPKYLAIAGMLTLAGCTDPPPASEYLRIARAEAQEFVRVRSNIGAQLQTLGCEAKPAGPESDATFKCTMDSSCGAIEFHLVRFPGMLGSWEAFWDEEPVPCASKVQS